MPKIAQRVIYCKLVKCYQYTLLRFSYSAMAGNSTVTNTMSYLALTKKKTDGEGKQRTQGFSSFILLFGGAKWTPTFKKKGGPYCTNFKMQTKQIL